MPRWRGSRRHRLGDPEAQDLVSLRPEPLRVVGDEDAGVAAAGADQALRQLTALLVEVRIRLVEQQQLGLVQDAAADREALAHPGGELADPVLGPVPHPDCVEQGCNPLLRRRAGEAVQAGVAQFAASFDARRGGFGGAPKFPRPSEALFLLEAAALTGDPRPRQMALETLRAMAVGGMRDHIGGGFHRYSVDAEWRVPHFEKMLYDQAQLVLAYLEAAQASGDEFFAAVAEDTIAYVLRDLTGPDGGFYSAEDADSVRIDFPVELIAEWRSGALENHGVILIQRTPGVAVEFASRGLGGTNRNGPLLDVEFVPPGATSSATILAIEDVFVAVDEDPLESDGGLVISGAEPVRRTFLDPDVEEIPDGITIAAARLVFTIDEARVPGDTLTLVMRPVLSGFAGEKTVLGPVTPSAVLGAVVLPPEAAPGDTLSFESLALTRLVREWVQDPETRLGVALTLVDERSAFGGVRLFGPEAPADVRPKIRILYIPPSDVGIDTP